MNLEKEIELNSKGFRYVYGIDEVGRGPIAGPIVICFYCFNLKNDIIGDVKDSKKVSSVKRFKNFDFIKGCSLDFSFGAASCFEIDRFGIIEANKLAIMRGFNKLKYRPDYLLFDYNTCNLNFLDMPYENIVNGDSLIYSIASASMLAKVFRDNLMIKLDKFYKDYDFKNNKGYGTKKHVDAISNFGFCPLHRRSFCKNLI